MLDMSLKLNWTCHLNQEVTTHLFQTYHLEGTLEKDILIERTDRMKKEGDQEPDGST